MANLTVAIQAEVDADHARQPVCSWCGRRGVPYVHNSVSFDGLHANRGDRLCPACSQEYIDQNGTDFLVIDGRPVRESYVYNTKRDRDLVTIRCEFADGRDMFKRRGQRGHHG